MELKDCFREDFSLWLLKSNNPKVGPYIQEERFKHILDDVVKSSLKDILDVLLREPLADYFWYGYPQYGGALTYTVPSDDEVPTKKLVPIYALRVDREKMKIFLRDIKLEKLLNN